GRLALFRRRDGDRGGREGARQPPAGSARPARPSRPPRRSEPDPPLTRPARTSRPVDEAAAYVTELERDRTKGKRRPAAPVRLQGIRGRCPIRTAGGSLRNGMRTRFVTTSARVRALRPARPARPARLDRPARPARP